MNLRNQTSRDSRVITCKTNYKMCFFFSFFIGLSGASLNAVIHQVTSLEVLLDKNDKELRAILTLASDESNSTSSSKARVRSSSDEKEDEEEEIRRLIRAMRCLKVCQAAINSGKKEHSEYSISYNCSCSTRYCDLCSIEWPLPISLDPVDHTSKHYEQPNSGLAVENCCTKVINTKGICIDKVGSAPLHNTARKVVLNKNIPRNQHTSDPVSLAHSTVTSRSIHSAIQPQSSSLLIPQHEHDQNISSSKEQQQNIQCQANDSMNFYESVPVSPEEASFHTLSPSPPSPSNSSSPSVTLNNKTTSNKTTKGFITTPPPRKKHQTLVSANTNNSTTSNNIMLMMKMSTPQHNSK